MAAKVHFIILFARRDDLGFHRAMNKTLASSFVWLLAAFGAGSVALGGSVSEPIPLWPKGAPDEKGNVGEEHDTTKPNDGLVASQRVIRLGNVSQPTLTLYRPAKEKDSGAAVVVCPGGGYSILAMDLEGTEICEWLNSIGATGVLLKYRVPARPGDEKHILPLQDAQRALGLVRFHAKQWNLEPNRIGVVGFSAGGHLTAYLSTHFDKRAYEPVDEADQVSCRPDFSMPIYPAYLVLKDQDNKLAPDLNVTANTPPTFLIQAEDDGIHVENSLFYYLALKKAKVPAELHLYASGGHGYGLRPSAQTVTTWPKRAEEWMRGLGVLR
jgi:acetyl esterase/lipase